MVRRRSYRHAGCHSRGQRSSRRRFGCDQIFPDNVVIAGNPARIIKTVEEELTEESLETLRHKIDMIDRELIALLEKEWIR